MKTDLKLCDKDDDGENPWKKKNTIPSERGTEQSSPLVQLKCEETPHGRHKTFSFC